MVWTYNKCSVCEEFGLYPEGTGEMLPNCKQKGDAIRLGCCECSVCRIGLVTGAKLETVGKLLQRSSCFHTSCTVAWRGGGRGRDVTGVG